MPEESGTKENPCWFRRVNVQDVQPDVRESAELMLAIVKEDLALPELEIRWCECATEQDAVSEQQERAQQARESGRNPTLPECFTIEAYEYLDGQFVHVLSTSSAQNAAFRVACKAKEKELWRNLLRYRAEDPLFDFNATARSYAREASQRLSIL
jgi:hypothetical protein